MVKKTGKRPLAEVGSDPQVSGPSEPGQNPLADPAAQGGAAAVAPPSKKRGRRRIADINAELEKSNAEQEPAKESNRKSGRMSLRPNRRVNVRQKYRY